jgi:hypothetical protein
MNRVSRYFSCNYFLQTDNKYFHSSLINPFSLKVRNNDRVLFNRINHPQGNKKTKR